MAAEQFKLVVCQAGSIPQILEHLQKQPISDIDGMLLSQAGLSDLPREPEHEVDIDIGHSWAVLRSPKDFGLAGRSARIRAVASYLPIDRRPHEVHHAGRV